MTKEKLIRKLTSRKFWVAIVSFVTALLTAFHVSDGSISQVSAIIMAFGSLVAYLFAEAMTDAASLKDGGGNSYTNNWSVPLEDEESTNDEDGSGN